MGMDFQEQDDGSCRVRVFSEWKPRNKLGFWLAKHLIVPKVDKDMCALVAHVGEFLGGTLPDVLPNLKVTAAAEKPLLTGLNEVASRGHSPQLIALLQELIQHAPDVEVSRIRPLGLARRWKQNSWKTLRMFLDATRAGVLELSWEILCPNCRSGRHEVKRSLGEVTRQMHCEVCQIDYDGQFDESVELKFTIHPAVRNVPLDTYCLAGPGARAHIISQITLGPNERRSWEIPPFDKAVRLRSPQVKQHVKLKPEEGGDPFISPVIICKREAFDVVTESTGGTDYNLRLINPNPYPVQLALERLEWDEDILTAARVTNWQDFRDLFAREVISPTEKVTVGSQIILFTDLRGSTAMYRDVGDAPAYALVRRHFDILHQVIGEGHGTVVKTIGDAVMAVFNDLTEALESVQRMHRDISKATAGLGSTESNLSLKSSLHIGPCLAVNANDRLDYFGTTINLAARMVDVSTGGDVVVSDELYSRPETADFVDHLNLMPELKEIQFRGFTSPQKVWRIPVL
jgi:adenylate cyclase